MIFEQNTPAMENEIDIEPKTIDGKMQAVFTAMRKMKYLVPLSEALAIRDPSKHDQLVSERYMQRDWRTIIAESKENSDMGPLACAEVALIAKKLTEETYGLQVRMVDTLSKHWLQDKEGSGQGHVFIEVFDHDTEDWQVYNPVTGEKCQWEEDEDGKYIHWKAGYQISLDKTLTIDDNYYRWLEENSENVPEDGVGYEGLYQISDRDKDYFDSMQRMASEANIIYQNKGKM
ncbi:MAG: hypothetical protein H6772_04060 [Pseudomonadales bacterium]|nr:hypothetical protein [Pseudomonadales bacterium]